MTTATKLDLIASTKEGLRSKLNVGKELPFSKYPDFIHIPSIPPLFENGEPGTIYDPSDVTTLYQNSTGTIPVTKNGDPVGLMLDKSQDLVLGPELFPNTISMGVGWVDNGGGSYTCNGSQTSPADLSDYTLYNTIVNKANTYTVIDVSYAPDTASTTAYAYVFHPAPTNSSLKEGINTRFGTDNSTFVVRAPVGVKLTVKISVKELKGNHALQSVSASRPIYQTGDSRGIVNILYDTENLNTAKWGRSNSTVIAVTDVLPPIEGMVVNKVTATASGSTVLHQGYNSNAAPIAYSSSVYVKAGTYSHVRLSQSNASNASASVTINLLTGEYSHRQGTNSILSHSVESLSNGWYRISIGSSNSTYSLHHFSLYLTSYPGASDSGHSAAGYIPNAGEYVYVAAPQFERLAIDTPNIKPLSYQPNGSSLSGINTGKVSDLHWLKFDGVDDTFTFTRSYTNYKPHVVFAGRAGTFTRTNYFLDLRSSASAYYLSVNGTSDQISNLIKDDINTTAFSKVNSVFGFQMSIHTPEMHLFKRYGNTEYGEFYFYGWVEDGSPTVSRTNMIKQYLAPKVGVTI